MRKLVVAWALAAATLVAEPLAAQSDPAALVIRVQGGVDVTHGGAAPTPASVGERMFVGDGVLPASGSRAILVTRAGAQQVVTQRTTIEEPRGGGSPDIFERAMATLAQAAATDATTGGRQGMIRPIPGQTSLVAPRNGLNVASPRPIFHWTATPGQSYDLMLRNLDGGRPTIYEVGADTLWTLPDDAPELEAGATYQWTVFVGGRRGGRALPAQDFRVIGPEESVELEDYLSEIEVFGLDPHGDGLLLTVIAYRDMGLFYEAREALDRVEAEAGLSWELHKLKGEILAELGHEEEARAAFDEADELAR
jgi:tetratricopeptide (TPR) repeat protein